MMVRKTVSAKFLEGDNWVVNGSAGGSQLAGNATMPPIPLTKVDLISTLDLAFPSRDIVCFLLTCVCDFACLCIFLGIEARPVRP